MNSHTETVVIVLALVVVLLARNVVFMVGKGVKTGFVLCLVGHGAFIANGIQPTSSRANLGI